MDLHLGPEFALKNHFSVTPMSQEEPDAHPQRIKILYDFNFFLKLSGFLTMI